MSAQNSVILIIIDGLAASTARDCMGYLQALCDHKLASRYTLESELPSLSRPLYETLLTGTTPIESGITHNRKVRLSTQSSVFSLAQRAGLTTAAAAYHWFSELYNRAPYEAERDRFTQDPELPIQFGCFYHLDHYPDEHLLLDADWLMSTRNPDFMLIHPMNVDDAGHKFGFDSSQYRNAARRMDGYLSQHLPRWMEQGYQILITSDHGMNNDRSHGGTLSEERQVPLWVIGDAFTHSPACMPRQVEVCGVVCTLLGLENHGKPVAAEMLEALQ
ncbi:alkaline phosphatase family protein [Marinobacterium sediminicola]|uniref:Type I phosphodiesterase / nucleotide pyrophosphatase n=1 Tax=Marinobacterium sediminicola TaxID=518898 RepID=A0ABY1RYP3_9GAMM|nr:alkaline phosphatase family protein [Marinobacterium sediminicola]ULG68087.1 alkaline phosphatase family protein [Marinobacterium sediminicola]SMR73401.1 Type I phosphodiesterase / nucleotide pyrophosphatase [Marinobacterium sediminicola]